MLYFYVWERGLFVDSVQPALAASWRERSFAPCQKLCRDLIPAGDAFFSRYCLGPDPLLLNQVAERMAFDRHSWRCLVGEILMIGAAEIPEFYTAPDSLCCILAPERYREVCTPRAQFAPIQQAHYGSHDLTFGAAFYRPEHAGCNDVVDVARLARYLNSVDPESWTADNLRGHRELADDQERAEELAYVRDWFPALCDMYQQACVHNQIIISENIS